MTDLILYKETMSSLEIAELTGKRHDAILRDIRNLLNQGVNAHNFVEVEYTDKKTMKTIDKLEIILQKMKEQNNRLERIYGKHLKLIVCTGKRSEKVKFKHED